MNIPPEIENFAQNMFSDKDFKEIHNDMLDLLLPDKGDNGLAPKLVIVKQGKKNGKFELMFVAIIAEHFNDYETRCEILRQLGHDCAEKEIQTLAVFLASEVWTVKAAVKNRNQYKQVSDHPDKTEALMVYGRTLDARSSLTIVDVTRDNNDNIKRLDQRKTDYNLSRDDDIQSSLVDYFWQGYMLEFCKEHIKNQTNH